jgi:hypothetical protein
MVARETCQICGCEMRSAFRAVLLNRHDVQYFSCSSCGLLRTEKPYWLDAAYSSAIVDTDTGLVGRNLRNARLLEPILHRAVGDEGTVLDIGGGYGLLARLLRDRGFNAYTDDPYCESVFARHFEPRPGFQAAMLTAFEVFEHAEDIRATLEAAFARYSCRRIIFSTATFEGEPPAEDWWYYTPETGQHISFYQRGTLEALAQALGCTYVPLFRDLHLISDRPVVGMDKVILSNTNILRLYSALVRRRRKGRSLVAHDHAVIRDAIVPPGDVTNTR